MYIQHYHDCLALFCFPLNDRLRIARPISIMRYEPEIQRYANSDTLFWSAITFPWQILLAFAFAVYDAIVLLEEETHESSSKQRYYCSHKKGPNVLTAVIQLLEVHAKNRGGKVDGYVDTS